MPKQGYRLRLPSAAEYQAVINTDDETFGGNKTVAVDALKLEDGMAVIDLPALSTIWFAPVKRPTKTKRKTEKRSKKANAK